MADVEIGVPQAGAGAVAPLPGDAPTVTVQKVGDEIHIVGDVSRLTMPVAVRLADTIWEALRS